MNETSFHNTTQLTGDELRDKDIQAKSQEEKIHWIMNHLQKQVEWWTRDALNREFTRRFGKRLKDQSISRALSNLSSMWCPGCKKYTSDVNHCIDNHTPSSLMILARLQKSDTAMWYSDERDRVHAWRLMPNPGQGDMFPNAILKEGLQ